MNKNVVAGLGEIGKPLLNLLKKNHPVIGYDISTDLINKTLLKKYDHFPTSFLHVCIPFNSKFIQNTKSLYDKFKPECIVIHSTISPNTTKRLQGNISVPVIYSATRGVHKRMLVDLKRYTKFFAIEKTAPKRNHAISNYSNLMKRCNVKTKLMSNPIALELAKIVVDTSYYGWLINYAQLSNIVAKKYNVDYDEMWQFSDEIHKLLGNRPKMFPGFIGGHCVIPNLSLLDEESFWQIDKINNLYAKKIKNAKSITKRYVRGKQSFNSK